MAPSTEARRSASVRLFPSAERIARATGWTRDLAFSLTAHVVQKLPGLVAAVVLARHFEKALIGQFFLCGVVATISAILSHLGTDRELRRSSAQQPERALERLGQVLALRLTVVALVWPTLNLVIWALDPGLLPISLLTSLYILIGDLFYTFAAVFVGLRRSGLRLAIGAIGPILIALASLAVFAGASLTSILALYVLANLLMVALAVVVTYRLLGPFALDWHPRRLRPVVLAAMPFFLTEIVLLVQAKIDVMMIYAMVSATAVADYEAAYRLLEVTRTLVRPLLMVFVPIAAAMAAIGHWVPLRRLVHRVLGVILLAGALLSALLVPLARSIVTTVWGDDYAASAPLFSVLAASTVPVFLVLACLNLAGALYRERACLVVLGLTAALNAAVNYAVIPHYGALGAAWTTLGVESVAAVALLMLVLRAARRGAESAGAAEVAGTTATERVPVENAGAVTRV